MCSKKRWQKYANLKTLLRISATMENFTKNFVTGYGVTFETSQKNVESFEKAQVKWAEISAELTVEDHEGSVFMFCGAKNNGKSSLVRHLVNEYNQKKSKLPQTNGHMHQPSYAYYIDFDPGQPEMTTPGCVSAHIVSSEEPPLTSPTYLNLFQHKLITMSCVGGMNMSVNPRVYIENCRHVLMGVRDHRKQQQDKRPVFINTMGFIRAVGLAILLDLIKMCKPSNLIVLNVPEDPLRIIGADLSPQAVRQLRASFYHEQAQDLNINYRLHLHNLQFCFIDSAIIAKKNRTAQQLAYLASINEALYKPVMQLTAKLLSFNRVSIHCVSSYPLSTNIVLEILPQSWVHLVKLRRTAVAKPQFVNIRDGQNNERQIVCNMIDDIGGNTMLGCGIVIGIDRKTMAIITPLSQEILDHEVDCVIKPLSIQVPQELLHA